MAVKKDNFLSDLGTNGDKHSGYSISDGFRLGFGFTIGFLLVALLLGSLTWGIYLLLHH
jgi:hypothetical protein